MRVCGMNFNCFLHFRRRNNKFLLFWHLCFFIGNTYFCWSWSFFFYSIPARINKNLKWNKMLLAEFVDARLKSSKENELDIIIEMFSLWTELYLKSREKQLFDKRKCFTLKINFSDYNKRIVYLNMLKDIFMINIVRCGIFKNAYSSGGSKSLFGFRAGRRSCTWGTIKLQLLNKK